MKYRFYHSVGYNNEVQYVELDDVALTGAYVYPNKIDLRHWPEGHFAAKLKEYKKFVAQGIWVETIPTNERD